MAQWSRIPLKWWLLLGWVNNDTFGIQGAKYDSIPETYSSSSSSTFQDWNPWVGHPHLCKLTADREHNASALWETRICTKRSTTSGGMVWPPLNSWYSAFCMSILGWVCWIEGSILNVDNALRTGSFSGDGSSPRTLKVTPSSSWQKSRIHLPPFTP